MLRGISTLNLDAKGRLAIPSRLREQLADMCQNQMVLTLNPLDRCLWLYPLPQWEIIDAKLGALSDFDKQSRRTKQMMWGHATECAYDSQGRILIPPVLRDFAGLKNRSTILGQRNKLEIWDDETWSRQREEWLDHLGKETGEPSELLRQLAL
ncbi:MAG: division/cell wall cluster transcriptional repressor MraZ [Gammaproteobacteria bacterium]